MASYDGATLKVTGLFSKGQFTANVLDFIHLSAIGVAELNKSTNLKGCPKVGLLAIMISSESPVSTGSESRRG